MSYKSEKFKQFTLPSLIPYIQNILRKYPDDGQILKEIIQNADDAQAKRVVFIYDDGMYGQEYEGHSILKGPKLYAYNDSQFEEKDWEGIKSIGISNKSKDPQKIGRFGLGFKSTFHLTDVPIVASGETMVYLDPTKKIAPTPVHFEQLESGTNLCGNVFENLPETFSVKDGYCNGSLFCFPLRKESSDISKTVYENQRLMELIEMFTDEGHLNILFLRNVNSIEIYKTSTDGICLLYSVKKEETDIERKVIYEEQKREKISKKYFQEIIKFNNVMKVSVEIYLNEAKQKDYTYVVSEQFGLDANGHQTFLDEDLNYLPSLSIAYPINGDDPGGHVFCGLPLPLQEKRMTGLPVHVQSYFALGEDRKDLIWKSDTTLSGDRNKNALWNQQLINLMLPNVYIELIIFLTTIPDESSVDAIYQCWPAPADVIPKWESFLSAFYSKLLNRNRCVFAKESNQWVTVQSCFFFSEPERTKLCFQELVRKLFSKYQISISLPPERNQRILSIYTTLFLVSKDTVKGIVKGNTAIYYTFSNMEKMELLNFMIQTKEDYNELKEEIIFPLRFSTECTNLTSKCFILEDERDVNLFKMIHDRILLTEGLAHTALNILQNVSCTGNHESSAVVWLNKWKLKLNVIKEYLPKDFVTEASISNLHIPVNEMETKFSILDWLIEFWNFIELNKVSFGLLTNLSVLQTTKGSVQYLSKLTFPPTTILFKYEELELPSRICDLFQNIGIGVAYHLPKFLQYDMNFINQNVFRPCPNGIVEVLSNTTKVLGEHFIKVFNQFVNEDTSQDFLQKIENYSKTKLPDLFNKLKFFKAIGKTNMVSSEESLFVDQNDLPPHFKTANCNFVANEIQGLKKFSIKKFCYNKILKFTIRMKKIYGHSELHMIYDFYVNNINTLKCDDSTLKELKKHITVATGNIRKFPHELFKKEQLVETLFSRQSNTFPNPSYNMEVLSFLGLKRLNDVNSQDFIKCITSIQDNPEDSTFVNKKVKTLLKVAQLLGINLVQFQDMVWMPVQENVPMDYPETMPFNVNKNKLGAPSQTILPIWISSAGAKYSVVQENIAKTVKDLLEFKTPTVSDVIDQLKLLSVCFHRDDHLKYEHQVQDVYKVLSLCTLSHLSLNFSFIWNGHGFVGKDEVVLEATEINLNPYFFTFPEKSPEFKKVLHSLNIGIQPEIKYYIKTLTKIRASHEAEENISPKKSKADLLLCLTILGYVSDHSEMIEEEEKHQLDIPLQQTDNNNKLVFKKANQCFYLESKNLWEGDPDYIEYDIVHESIKEELADTLGIPHVESEFVSDGETLFVPWGQSEPLTTRLNRLLIEYVDGLPIPKEMIQNADDAGAKEVCFLFDQRENEKFKSSLFDNNMANWQGPALWVYNDAKFKSQDFKNLIQLNASQKETDATKIGKFGLGFNSVYHLTDVPSLLSGDSLVIFDPHFKYLKKVLKSPAMPGVKVQIKNKKLAKFKDQLQIFNGVFGAQCDLYTGKVDQFNGTLFRLPLRNHYTSGSSNICKRNYNAEEVIYLLQMLEKSLDYLLLFTEHVEKVSVYHLSENAESPEEMKRLYSLEKSEIFKDPSFYRESLLEISKKILERRHSDSEVSIIKKVAMDINVTQVYSALLQTTCKQTLSPKQLKHEYLVSNFTGNTASMAQARRITGVLPCAGVAVSLRPEKIGGKLFCFLPLPIESYLPVHVNATFEVTSSRRELKSTSSDSKQIVTYNWNDSLAEDISKAYYYLVLDLKERFNDIKFHDWIKFLPFVPNQKRNMIKSSILEGIKQFYNHLLNHDAIFPLSLGDEKHVWISFENMFYFDNAFPKNMAQPCLIFMNLYYNQHGGYFVEMPEEMYDTLTWLNELKRNIDIDGVFDVFFEALGVIEIESTLYHNLLIYALTHYQDKVKNHSCIPTIPNGQLRKPCELIKPNSKISILYQENDHVFPIESLKRYWNQLMNLGMNSVKLTSLQIIDRAKRFANIGNGKHTNRQISVLLSLIKEQIPFFNEQCRKELRFIPFLPVLKKPENYPYKIWFGDKGGLHPSTNMYLENYTFVCGPTSYICNRESIDFELAEFLGLTKAPEFERFQAEFSQMIRDIEASKFSRIIMKQVYHYIERLPTNSTEKLRDKNIILTDSGKLVSSKLTAKNLSDEIPGYMYKFPDWIQNDYPNLTEALEIDDVGYVGIIKMFQTTMAQIYSDFHEQVIPQKVLKPIVKMVIPLLAMNKTYIVQDIPIYVPSNKCRLRNIDDLQFKDVNWLDEEEEEIVHQEIPHIYSIQLGIKRLFGDYLLKKSIGIGWGQHEDIATRIKNILGGYSEHIDVVKELIQNADDAQATAIEFILDKRIHKKEKVFSPKWKDMQGPALIVVNDGIFTEKDLTGIKSLGVGSKADEPHKIGTYGVGFNSVFQITDCPSFIVDTERRNVLAVFDPSLSCLECSTSDKAGILIENARTEINEKFKDLQSSYFFERGFPRSNFLLRLPLRLREAPHSLAKSVNPTSLDFLLQNVYKGAHYLLFTKHLKKISFNIIEENEHVSFDKKIIARKFNLEETSHSRATQLAKNETWEAPEQKSYKLCIQKQDGSNIQSIHWLLFTQAGFVFQGDEELKKFLQSGDSMKYPTGAIAIINKNQECSDCKLYPELPDQENSSIICCGLPLPMVNTMPVSINGSFFLEYETRRSLWNNTNDSFKRQWNNCIMKYCIAPCYVNFLIYAAEKLELFIGENLDKQIENFFSAFPYIKRYNKVSRENSNDLYMKELCVAVYNYLYHESKAIFPVLMDKKIKCHPPFNCETGSGFMCVPETLSNSLEDILNTIGITIGRLPYHIEKSLSLLMKVTPVAARAKIVHLSPAYVVNKLAYTDTILELLEYCLSESFDVNAVNELPLCLTQGNTVARFSSQHPIYFVKNPQMFEGSIFEKQFVAEGTYNIIHKAMEKCKERRLPKGLKDFSLLDLQICLSSEFSEISTSLFIEWSQIKLNSDRIEEIWEFILENIDIDSIKESAMQNFCLVPAIRNGIPMLVKICRMKCVLNMFVMHPKENFMLVDLKKCLKRIGVLESQNIFVSKIKPISITKKLAGSIEGTLDVIDAMLFVKLKISVKDAEILQSYISSKIDVLPRDKDIAFKKIVRNIKSLPIFIKSNGELTNLQAGMLLVKDGTSPNDGIWKIKNAFACELLRFKPEYRKLFDIVGIEILDDTDFYIKYVMKRAELLTNEEVDAHIKFIRETLFGYIPQRKEEALKNAMANAYCFRTRNNNVTKPNLLFDPRIEIFETMLDPDRFPAEWYSDDYLDFMNEIGMNSEVTEKLFLDFAARLTSFRDANKISKSSELLVKHLIGTPSLNTNENFLMKVNKISFIPAKILDASLESLHRSKNCEQNLISFEGSVVSGLTNLAWTNHYVLPYEEDFFGYNMTFLKMLGVKCKLSTADHKENLLIKDVLYHLNNITKNTSFKMVSRTCKIIPLSAKRQIVEIFTCFYDKLSRLQLDNCPGELKEEFCESAWVLVNGSKMLDVPRNTLLDEKNSVVPLYNVVAIPKYQSIYMNFGFSPDCNVSSYARVLKEIKSDSAEGSLNPNQIEASMKCIGAIAMLLKIGNDASGIKTLYVPSIKISNQDQVFLHKSTNVYYDMGTLSRFPDFEHPVLKAGVLVGIDLKCNLPNHLKLLSYDAHAKEVLDKDNIMVIPNELSKQVMEKLKCPLFLRHLKLMFQVAIHSKENHHHKDWDDIQGIITSVEVYMVSEVKTYMKYKEKRLENSESYKPYFVEKCSNKFVFYYNCHESVVYTDFSRELLNFLQLQDFQLLSNLLPSILTQPSTEIGSFLKSRNVDIDVDLISDPLRPPYRPGEYVPQEHYPLLERTFDEFYESEIIALEKTDEEDDDIYYIYAKVIECIDEVQDDKNVTLRYKVRIGDVEEDIAVVKAYEMYHFKKYSKLVTPPSEQKLVLYQGEQQQRNEDHKNQRTQTTDLKKIKLEIDKIFKEIEGLPDDERKKVLKRLWLRWHPDKNPAHLKSLSEEVFKYIQNKKDKKVAENESKWQQSASRDSQQFNQYWSNFTRQQRQPSGPSTDSSSSRRNQFYDDLPRFNTKNPQPAEAKRWYRQAKYDFKSITADIEGGNFVWACFKAHQAAEKALKAAKYNIDVSGREATHHLPSIANGLGSELVDLSIRLERLLGSSTKMRYPDNWNPPTIPQDCYDANKANQAHEIVEEIMKLVMEQIN